jgi:hypothetical protein
MNCQKVIDDLVDLNDQLYFLSMDHYFMDDKDPLQDEVDLECFLVMEACKSSRYMFRAPNYRKLYCNWQVCLSLNNFYAVV